MPITRSPTIQSMILPTTIFFDLSRDAKLLIIATGVLAVSFFGIQMSLSTALDALRLGL